MASALETSESEIMGLVASILSEASSSQLELWNSTLEPERKRTKKAHVMSVETQEVLSEMKTTTGYTVSLLVELGLAALWRAVQEVVGTGRGKSGFILDRMFSHIAEAKQELLDVDDKFAANSVSCFDLYFDKDLEDVKSKVVDHALAWERPPSIFETFQLLSPSEQEEIVGLLRNKLELRGESDEQT